MKIFIVKVIKFAIFCCLVYTPFLFLIGYFGPQELQKNLLYKEDTFLRTKLDQISEFSDVDILFIGSSHAYRSFDPRIFASAGYSTFNLGSSAQTPINTEILLERYLDAVDPEMVAYEVYPDTFASDGVESTADIISSDVIGSDIFGLVCRQNNIIAYNTFLFGYIRELLSLKGKSPLRLEHGGRSYISGGYVETYSTNEKNYKGAERKLSFREEQEEAFERILTTFEERGIDLVMVQTPVTSSRYNTIVNNEFIDSFFSRKGEYINYNGVIDLDDVKDFSDTDHLNQYGAEKFCKEFLYYLACREVGAEDDTEIE